MSKKRVKGHKENAKLNGEWEAHTKDWTKKLNSSLRRTEDRIVIRRDLSEYEETKKEKPSL